MASRVSRVKESFVGPGHLRPGSGDGGTRAVPARKVAARTVRHLPQAADWDYEKPVSKAPRDIASYQALTPVASAHETPKTPA